tara:strand:+ start:313 stop:600 length:288 start_codon:yes stop_codon:yes gene_type:complete
VRDVLITNDEKENDDKEDDDKKDDDNNTYQLIIEQKEEDIMLVRDNNSYVRVQEQIKPTIKAYKNIPGIPTNEIIAMCWSSPQVIDKASVSSVLS